MQLRYVNMRLPIIAMFLSITAFTFIVPIDSTQAQSGMGNGMRPEGMRPEGMRPEGMRPEGMRPEGMRPGGMRPEGMRPEGMRPGGKGTTEDTEIIKNLED